MAAVYEARRATTSSSSASLKIMDCGVGSALVAQFRAERQIPPRSSIVGDALLDAA